MQISISAMKKKLRKLVGRMIPAGIKIRLRKQHLTNASYPAVYNSEGEAMTFCYLSAPGSEHHPYSLTDGRRPKRIVWDRFNFGLDTHLYTSENIFRLHAEGTKHYGLLMEGEAIIPKVYERARKNPAYIESRLTALFTHKAEFLNLFKNARFCPAYSVWYGTRKWGGEIKDEQEKTKMISFVGCDKSSAAMHLFRQEVTRHFLGSQRVDVYGKAVGRFASCDEIFSPYRYNIAIENARYDYYFTEKILNCFASKTVPVYYGCPGIGKFFNTDGIIVIEEPAMEAVERALLLCSEADYERRRAAIDDNFNRVKEFLCVDDYLCAHYPEILG